MRKSCQNRYKNYNTFLFRIEDKLKISSQYRIEADANPTCLVQVKVENFFRSQKNWLLHLKFWPVFDHESQYPSGRFEEEFLFTANDRFKLRLFNQSTKLPRRTTNSQQYDSPIRQ